jgi:glycosyltransferase involved in cell wall biosynthesis
MSSEGAEGVEGSFDTLTSMLSSISTAPVAQNVPSSDSVTITLDPPAVKGKLCLNMIVKNESKIIRRLIDSVAGIIDAYCICDTGSTDDTIKIIQDYMQEKNIVGEVYQEPFKNFGYNRTHALRRAERWADYALLLDADMTLTIKPQFVKADLKEAAYSLMQKNGGLEYYNTRIVNTSAGVKCLGPTHEYYDIPGGKGCTQLKTLVIEDIGDGGAKADKFERDVRLLKQGLIDEPGNVRYMFYLANSYRDLGRHEESVSWYKKRFEAGGWIEEVFYAAYEAGNQYKAMGQMENALYWWFEAYNRHPVRAESLYEAVKWYRESGRQMIGQAICDLARSIPYPKDDVLFIKSDIYNYLLDYEHTILAYYSKAKIDHRNYLALVGRNYNKLNVLSNYIFYVKKLSMMPGVKIYDFCGKVEKKVQDVEDDFLSSSPCIIPWSDATDPDVTYLLNVRYVNYYIEPNGSYKFKHDNQKITTINRTYWLDRSFAIRKEHWLDKVEKPHLRYQGVEDVKIFQHKDQLLFLGTVEDPETGNIRVGHGSYTFTGDRLASTPFQSPLNRGCEKNWCYVTNAAGELKVLYDWSPLTIGITEGNNLRIQSRNASVPPFFQDLRGSTNGAVVGSERWFLCHIANYTTPRTYYHMIVVLDENLNYKRNSILFKFHDVCIEYALGMIVEDERLIITYSKMDRTSAILEMPRTLVESELFA